MANVGRLVPIRIDPGIDVAADEMDAEKTTGPSALSLLWLGFACQIKLSASL